MFKQLFSIGLIACLLTISNISSAQYVFERFDINPRGGSEPSSIKVVDTFLYFLADDGTHGREPWICDGTFAGTRMIKDIIVGKPTSTGPLLGTINKKVIFMATDYTHGYEPWITDGTSNGTLMLKDIYTGPPHSIATGKPSASAIGGKLYFNADDGPHGQELWVTDGTTNGTKLVKDINPGIGNSQPSGFIAYKGKVYFVANDGTHAAELWMTDGTSNGTKLVIDLSPGGASGYINLLTVYNNKLYFTGYHNATFGLLETDGTANGTKFIKSISISRTVNNEINIVLFNGKMYFSGGDTTTPTKGAELWESDGTTIGTKIVKDINPYFGQSSNPQELTVVGNKLFFSADDGVHHEELWVTDGTTNGTKMVKDISTHASLGSEPNGLIAYGNKIFFHALANSVNHIDTNNGLWASDGTSTGTKLVKGYDSYTRFYYEYAFAVCNDALYFSGYDSAGHELWKLTDTTLNTSIPNSITTTHNKTSSTIKIAPNPAHGSVFITLDKTYKDAKVSITDLTGKLIFSKAIDATQKNIELTLPTVPTGVYLLNLHHKEGTLTERLLIE